MQTKTKSYNQQKLGFELVRSTDSGKDVGLGFWFRYFNNTQFCDVSELASWPAIVLKENI